MKKLTLKSIITAIITAAMLVTGLNTNYVTTVSASNIIDGYIEFKNGENLTLKPGDIRLIKFFIYDDEENKVNPVNYTVNFKWTTSDESIAKIAVVRSPERDRQCLKVTAVNAGTATITATLNDMSFAMTVTVKEPEMTAKQKKCKHKYKVTKKATCERKGIKTCKKCKWQVKTAMKPHKWVEETYTKTVYTEYHKDAYCMGCNCPDVPKGVVGHDWHAKTHTECTSACTKEWTTEDYDGSYDAMMEAIEEHLRSSECNNYTTNRIQIGEYMGGPGEKVTKTITICDNCGEQKR